MKKTISRIFALIMTVCIVLSLACGVSAANATTTPIDYTETASLTLYKYDMTAAVDDGKFNDESYVSTGFPNEAIEERYADYAIEGVEFTCLRLADIANFSEAVSGADKTRVLYGFANNTATTRFLEALDLSSSDAYRTASGTMQFESDTLIDALSAALAANETETKNALEALITANSGVKMPETDENGYSTVDSLPLGLYLMVETRVPENVTNTTAPFLVSLPMTTIDGDNWNYDVTVYPKNLTGVPTLDKTVRESKADTGLNNGSTDDILDGYDKYAIASDGDEVDYQMISKLPSITSDATELSVYTFVDTLSKGVEYTRGDVRLEWYKDEACTDLITAWAPDSGKFQVAYGTADNDATTMTITMTADGLNEINNATSVYANTSLYRGYSDCTVRITYSGKVNSSADTVYGMNGNPNEVVLTWKRTNTSYYDTLESDAIVYTYGIELTKTFSDEKGDVSKVEFLVHNDTDNYWVVASYNSSEGIYYVTGHTDKEANATHFVPNSSTSKVLIKGTETDAYSMTEIATDDGYTLLTAPIAVQMTFSEDGTTRTSSATVDSNAVTMLEDRGSASAIVPLTVVNTRGFDLPKTGDRGVWMYGVIGALVMAAGAAVLLAANRKSKKSTN